MSQVKKDLLKGVLYTGIAKYAGIFIHLLVTAILARLLLPEDFGVIALILVVINFFSMLSDMGIGPAIIQKKDLTATNLSHIFSLTIYIGVVLAITFFFLSGLFAQLYQNNALKEIMQWFSLAIFFHCADIVPVSLIKKSKNFRFIAYSNILIQTLCGVLAVIIALLGYGIYALLIQPILGSLFLFVVNCLKTKISFSFTIQIPSIKKIFSYSVFQFMFSFVNYFSRNLDKLIVGKSFGVTDLGYYEKSYRLMMLPVGNLSHIITPAIQPIFSEYQNDKQWLFSKSMHIFKILAVLGFPLSAFLFFSSEELILIVFGSQWEQAIPIFKILSLSVGVQILYSPQGAFFQSANAVKEMFYCGIVTAIMNLLAVFLGCFLFQSLPHLAYFIDIAYICAFFLVYYVMMKFVFAKKFILFLKILLTPLMLTSCLIVLLYTVHTITCDMHILITLTIKAIAFILLMFFFELKTHTFRKYLNWKKNEK